MASCDMPEAARPGATDAQAPAAVGPGRVLGGRYRLESQLAQGGMGAVYRATQLALGRPVAIKVLRNDYRARRPRDFHRRFAVEARAAALLTHPHSVTVLDYGCEADGTYYLVMERLRGRTLAELLLEVGPITPARALNIALQVGRAVQAAHATGIVHRDLKPANVMVLDWGEDAADARDDFVKVLDFGLAKQFGAATESLTRTGQFLGSPGYMAPEQITGAELDGRCDVYALGAVLFQMLVGRPPYAGLSPHEVMRAHLHEPVPALWPQGREGVTRLAVDVETTTAHAAGEGTQRALLEALVHRALAKKPEDRFASMGKMLEALHRAAAAVGDAPPQTSGHVDGPTVARWVPAGSTLDVTQLGRAQVPAEHSPGPAPALMRPAAAGVGAPLALALEPSRTAVARRGRRPARETSPRTPRAWRQRLRYGAPVWLGAALSCAIGQAMPAAHLLPPAATPALAAARPMVAADPAVVRLQLDSVPQGAQVFAGGRQLCAATPCLVAWPTPDATQEAIHARVQLRFALDAHDDMLVHPRLPTADAAGDGLVVAVSAQLR